jgi:pSer/pThr/pTyr-binding forkhead associated (FHA) protein
MKMEPKLCILVGHDECQSFDLQYGKTYSVGRSSDNDITIKDNNISRHHFTIRSEMGKYFITDLNTKNGTFVGGNDISPGVEVEVDERTPIVIGMTALGLGEVCETCMKYFLDSIGICSERCENGELSRPERVHAIKTNLEFIYNINNGLDASKDLKEIYEKVLSNVFSLLKRVDRCAVVLTNKDSGKIAKVIYRSRKPVDDPKNLYSRELVEHTLMLQKAVIVSDSSTQENEDDKITESMRLKNIRSAMCVPMCSCFQTRGAIYVDSFEKPCGFRKSDLVLLKDAGSRAALAMDNITLRETIGYKNHD